MNFFGQPKQVKGKNPLAALMQPNLMEMLQQEQPHAQTPMSRNKLTRDEGFLGGQPTNQPPPQQQPPPPVSDLYADGLPTGPGGPTVAAAKPPLPTPEEAGGLLWRGATVGAAPLAATGLVGKKLYDMVTSGSQSKAAQPVNAPPASPTAAAPQEEPLEQTGAGLDAASPEGFTKSAFGAVDEMMQKYGKMAQTMQGAKDALKAEFQDTPELDAIIAKTEQELSQTRANRKQPGIGEFLVMALMNLGGMNPRQSADLVLGLGEQRQDEMRLSDRLAQLEGSRAGAKMQGRQTLRATERQDKYQQLQNALRQQETGRRQANEDRDFNFKSQKFGGDKLMQALGQLRQQMNYETDPMKKKALQDKIDKMDPYNPKNQQQQKPQPDQRQSRLFGDLVGGGGYA